VRKESVVTRAHRVSSRVALLLAAWVAGCGESDEPTAASPVSASRSAPLHDAATVAHLEATYGKNLLETDPIGNAPPANAKDTDVFLRWYGDSPKLLNANVRGDGNLADALLSYCLLDFAQRHVQDPSKFAPGVADYAAVSPDQRSLVVHLMPGIRWQFPAVDRADPKYRWLVDLYASAPPELTADDVVFTVTTILTPGVGGGGQRSIFDGVTVEALDRYTYPHHVAPTEHLCAAARRFVPTSGAALPLRSRRTWQGVRAGRARRRVHGALVQRQDPRLRPVRVRELGAQRRVRAAPHGRLPPSSAPRCARSAGRSCPTRSKPCCA
jgi:hypothetical protein